MRHANVGASEDRPFGSVFPRARATANRTFRCLTNVVMDPSLDSDCGAFRSPHKIAGAWSSVVIGTFSRLRTHVQAVA